LPGKPGQFFAVGRVGDRGELKIRVLDGLHGWKLVDEREKVSTEKRDHEGAGEHDVG